MKDYRIIFTSRKNDIQFEEEIRVDNPLNISVQLARILLNGVVLSDGYKIEIIAKV